MMSPHIVFLEVRVHLGPSIPIFDVRRLSRNTTGENSSNSVTRSPATGKPGPRGSRANRIRALIL